MRLLHVIDTQQLRGAEIFASDLIRALSEAGIEQRVIVLPDARSPQVEFDVPTRSLEASAWKMPVLHMLPGVRALRAEIRSWTPDIVQAHGGDSHKYTILASLGRPTPIVYRKIGLTDSRGLKRSGHASLMRRTTRIVAVADSVRREIVDVFRVRPDQVVTIPNAVDRRRMKALTEASATRGILGIPSGAPVIISLGALTWEKDPLSHVEIGARVVRKLPDAVHLIVGDGPLLPQVKAAIHRQGLNGRIRVLPARHDVPDLLAMSNVLLLASRTEGMPGSLIEAGMMGLPVAAYAVAGVPDVVVDGTTGRLTTVGDVEGLSERVLEIIQDREAAEAMGWAARERCLLLFDIGAIAPRYLKLYEEIGGT